MAIYFRGGEVVVVPQGGGDGGAFFDVEPIEVCTPDAGVVQAAVERAFDVAAAAAADTRPKGWKTPLLARFRVRSYKAFVADATFCLVLEDGGKIDVERWQPARDGRGFEPARDGLRRVEQRERMGEHVLAALAAS